MILGKRGRAPISTIRSGLRTAVPRSSTAKPERSGGSPGSTGGGRRLRGRWIRLPAVVAQTIRAAYRFPEKTSFQPPQRSPRTPRALYFHDEIWFGHVQGGRSVRTDPESIPNTKVGEGRQAGIRAPRRCLECQQGATEGVPVIRVKFGRAGPMVGPLSAEPR